MTPKNVERLVKVLRASGVSHFKDHDFEIRFGPDPQPNRSPANGERSSSLVAPVATPSTASGATPSDEIDVKQKEVKIPHRITELNSLLKLSSEDLVDKIFPVGDEPDPFVIPQSELVD